MLIEVSIAIRDFGILGLVIRDKGLTVGFFDKIKQSLTRTKEQFVERFEEVVKRADEPAQRSQPIDVETVEALEEALISADVGVAATEQIVQAVRARRGRGESLRSLVKEEIRSILRGVTLPVPKTAFHQLVPALPGMINVAPLFSGPGQAYRASFTVSGRPNASTVRIAAGFTYVYRGTDGLFGSP